jgi:hypothetical protein
MEYYDFNCSSPGFVHFISATLNVNDSAQCPRFDEARYNNGKVS